MISKYWGAFARGNSWRSASQRGDTIIEVLIAIMIIGVILTGGYTAANISYAAERQAQERGIALGLLQAQLEGLRSLSGAPPTYSFCLVKDSGNTITVEPSATGQDCYFSASGTNENNVEPIFHIQVTSPPNPTNPVFTATEWWYQAGGPGKESLTMYYKLYLPS